MIYRVHMAESLLTWTCLYFSFVVLVGHNFVSGICKLKPKKKLLKTKNLFFSVLKNLGFSNPGAALREPSSCRRHWLGLTRPLRLCMCAAHWRRDDDGECMRVERTSEDDVFTVRSDRPAACRHVSARCVTESVVRVRDVTCR